MHILLSLSSCLTINFPYLLALALFASGLFASGSVSNLFACKQPNGQTKLAGSSSGFVGVDAPFDYVTSSLTFDPSQHPGLLTGCQVIGGGLAGLTVATGFVENPAVSVAVSEADSFYEIDNGNLSQTSVHDTYFTAAPPSISQPLIDWGVLTVPQVVCLDELHFQFV